MSVVRGSHRDALRAERTAATLRDLLGPDRVSTGESDLRLHSEDLSFHPAVPPDVVVFAESEQDVVEVLRWAHRSRVPVVPFGAGTSLEGHVIPVHGGVSLDLTRMDRVLAVHNDDLAITVQAGVTRSAVDRAAGEHGLYFPIDPGADATVGGMAATNAAGTMTLRHGKMRGRVLELVAVLPGGRRIRTGTAAPKSSAGYDLTSLLVGSEGTLGVITEMRLRLEPIPEATAVVRASFTTVDDAAAAAQLITAVVPAARRSELLDDWEVDAVNAFSGANLPVGPLLIVEAAGNTSAAVEAVGEESALVESCAASLVVAETELAGQQAIWKLRHDAFFAERMKAPGRESVSTDVCVPVSELAATVKNTRAALEQHRLIGGIVCHAGDGNVHAGVLVDPSDHDEMDRLDRFLRDIADDASVRGGSCSGEHGIGLGKQEQLARQHPDLLDLMVQIKAVFDPHGIMNPGKLLPPAPL